MIKCKTCHHECHCSEDLHSDEYGLCTCENCTCEKERANDTTYENER